MSILGPSSTDDVEAQALAEIRAAGHTDWRAAAWLLQHHPETRERFADWGRTLATQKAVLLTVMQAADQAGLTPELKYKFLLAMQAADLPTDKDYTDEPDPSEVC